MMLILVMALAGCAATPREDAEPRPLAVPPPTTSTAAEIRAQHDTAPPPSNAAERADRAHDWLFTNVQEWVTAADRAFATEEAEPLEARASPFRLAVSGELLERPGGADFDLDADIDVSLDLPNLSSRARLFITNRDIDDSPQVAGETNPVRVGLGFQPFRVLDFSVGLQADIPPVLFTSVRWAREIPVGRWDFYPFAKIFWETDDGAGASGALTFDRWSGPWLFRTSSFARWLYDSRDAAWTQTLIFAHAQSLIVPDRFGRFVRETDIGRGVALRLLAKGPDTSSVEYYEAGLMFKIPTGIPWLFWFMQPLVRWQQVDDWNPSPGIQIGLDAVFWDLAHARRSR
jgi:hypothetical protein